MAQAGMSVQLAIPEIYQALCPKCKKTLRRLIKEKISDEMVSQVLGLPKK